MSLPTDPILLELVPEFVASWQSEVETVLPTIIAQHHREELYRFGHTLKGSARQFGFTELAELGSELMQSAQADDWSTLPQITTQIRDALATLHSLLQQQGSVLPDKPATNL